MCFVILIVYCLSQEFVVCVVFCNETDSTANKSQNSVNKSNTGADLQHFPNNQMDSNVTTSKDSLSSSEKKEDVYTSDEEESLKQNTRQRTYHHKILTYLNSNKRASYYKRKLDAQEQKREELNTEKETSI